MESTLFNVIVENVTMEMVDSPTIINGLYITPEGYLKITDRKEVIRFLLEKNNTNLDSYLLNLPTRNEEERLEVNSLFEELKRNRNQYIVFE